MQRFTFVPQKARIILRQKPSPMVFAFMPETVIDLKHDAPGIGRIKDFPVPPTVWAWDPKTNHSVIRVVVSTEGRILLKQFVLGNVHENDNICWGGNMPGDLRSQIQTFWESPFNDDLTPYPETEFDYTRFLEECWQDHPRRGEYDTLTAQRDVIAQMEMTDDYTQPDCVADAGRTHRRVERAAGRIQRRAQNILGNDGSYTKPAGLARAVEIARIKGQDTEWLDHRCSCLSRLIDGMHAIVERSQDKLRDMENAVGIIRSYYFNYWQRRFQDYTHTEADSGALLMLERHFGKVSLVEQERILGDEEYPSRVSRYHQHAQMRSAADRIMRDARSEWERSGRGSIRHRWWKEGEWEMVGEAEDYTDYVMGDERQMYDSLQALVYVRKPEYDDGSPFYAAMQSLPEETWQHYPEGFLFPVFRTKDRDVYAALILEQWPFIITNEGGYWNWIPYDEESRKERDEIEEVFA